MKTHWSTRFMSTARHPLGDALEGVLSGILAREARVTLNPRLAGLARATGGHAPVGRLREVLDRDRALVAAGAPSPATPDVTPLAIVPAPIPAPVPAPRTPVPAGAFATPDGANSVRGACTVPVVKQPAAAPAERTAEEPIRTRTMARLLAAQGHRARALSIYDALLAADPDPELRAEAERLRAQEN